MTLLPEGVPRRRAPGTPDCTRLTDQHKASPTTHLQGTRVLPDLPLDARSLSASPTSCCPAPRRAPWWPRLLLVDDNELDVELTLLALAGCGLHEHVSVAVDGPDALDFLQARGSHAGRPPGLPDLVLLDLNLPRLDGRAVLRAIRADPALCGVRVVILTTSTRPEDRAGCEAADAYLVKPLDLGGFTRLLEAVAVTVETTCRERPEPCG